MIKIRPSLVHKSLVFSNHIGIQNRCFSDVRFNSNSSQTTKANPYFNKGPIFLISIPITTTKSFIYCKHNALSKVSTSKSLETKIISLANKGWNKLLKSEASVNKKIVSFIKKLLTTIPYDEACLKSFPSKESILREVNLDSIKDKSLIEKLKIKKTNSNVPDLKHYKITQQDILKHQISSNTIVPLPLYHASFQSQDQILTQLNKFVKEGESSHWKYLTLCAIGIPISLPIALVPVVPNVPGFYLTYRLYCHYKSLVGIKHLNYLLEGPTHLKFKSLESIDDVYDDIKATDKEEILISNDIIDKLCEEMDLVEIVDDLKIALIQETKRLNPK